MGCTLAKPQFRYINANNNLAPVSVNADQQLVKSEEAEVSVIHHGKGSSRTHLDDLTDTNLNFSPLKPIPLEKPSSELISKTLELNLIHPVSSLQSKTEKMGFENHPHSFDFSFIEMKPDPINDDLDKFYKEIQEMN